MKLNKLFYLLVAVSAIFVACDNGNNSEGTGTGTGTGNGSTIKLTVTETTMDVAFWGGKQTFNYIITGAEEDAKPTVKTNADWISNFVVADDITFDVAVNSNTMTRTAAITVEYGGQSKQVILTQGAAWEVDVEFTSTVINGEYYGTQYAPNPNYYLIMSSTGALGTGQIPIFVDSFYYFDIYSDTTAGDVVTLPHGVYAFDEYDQGIAYTFGSRYSLFFKTFDDGKYKDSYFSDGVLIVTENRIEAYVQLTSGEVHHVVYEGSLELAWYKLPEPDYYSNLTADYSFNHSDGIIRFFHYGDYYGKGLTNWTISVMVPGEPINGDYIIIDLVDDQLSDKANLNTDDVIGTYTCVADASAAAANTFIAGSFIDNKGEYSWYYKCVDGYYGNNERAPLKNGTISIAKEGTGYLVTFDCVDDNNHKITGTFNCPDVEIY